eukprot:CAMPEP_0114342686 /NCGR_PEP_ID=MMETSP0101-20121206/9995_1 /TAXON_ID=38822 ORGANISM="Pteridomonas danica, Strain PT" /NCGR_SAMPLE_ID=MMETSP0101 /ASSEMBLY_ACC=CAM_ASM_000211 /LENGTH=68 /DNA_ID=CAMNT_0001476937 /DNA_START=269 /DNA_END=475 /DNA_ORIENTATION=-
MVTKESFNCFVEVDGKVVNDNGGGGDFGEYEVDADFGDDDADDGRDDGGGADDDDGSASTGGLYSLIS